MRPDELVMFAIPPDDYERYNDDLESDDLRNFRAWVYVEVFNQSGEWNYDTFKRYFELLSSDNKTELAIRFKIECDPGRYV